jgi:hypothetical protein
VASPKKLLHKCGRIWHKKWINHDIPPFLEKMSDLTAKVMNSVVLYVVICRNGNCDERDWL